jgi:uncharacterized repeat protein (TIGR01451 family)
MRSVFYRGWQPFLLLLLIGFVLVPSNSAAQPGTADLQIMYTNSPSAVTLGQYFKCSVYVYNPGWGIATNIIVTNQVPPGLEFVSASSTRGACSQTSNVVTWQVGDFLPSYFAAMTMEFKATELGTYTNSVSAASATPESNPTNNQATLTTSVTQARFIGVGNTHVAFYSRPTLTLMTNNQVLVIGQHLGTTADLYNMSSRTFILPNGPTFGAHEEGTATVLSNGLVLIAGGLNATGDRIAEVYNPGTQLFRRVGDMLVYCYRHRATLQPDGTVLLCGGTLTANALFNPGTETFSAAPLDLPCPPAGTRLPDGRYFQGSGGASIYDPVTGISTPTSPMNFFRFNWTATTIPQNKVLVAGGDRNSSAAELYDISTGKFSVMPSMNMARNYHNATLLPDGTVLVVGGVNPQNLLGNNYAEMFDPVGAADAPGIGVSDASVVEGSSGSNWLQFTVWLTTNSAFPVTVDFATAQGSAGTVDWGVANVDFANTNGTLTFAPGVTNAAIRVLVFDDPIWEPNETFTVTLTMPTQAWMARATATGTIFNDDPLPTLSVSPGTLTEGDLARSNMTLQVSLSMPTPATVTVDYFTTNVTASANSDYLPTNGTLAFGPGATVLIVDVPVIGDMSPESDETFSLNITNAQNALIAGAAALGTIVNDDALPGRLHHFDWSVISSPQVRAAAFPVTITARDYFGGVATNVPWPVRLSAQTTNYAATNLDFEAPTLAPWTPFNYAPYEKTFDLQPVDVSGLGAVSMAFRMSANGGTNGITQNISLTGGIPYTISANVLIKVDDVGQSCWGGVLHLEAGTNSTSIVLPDMCAGTVRTKISLAFTPPTNGIYPLRFTTARSYWGEYYWVYLDDVQIGYPVITPTVATNFINGVWTGSVAVFQPAVNVSLLANDNAGHQGTSGSFDIVQGHFELSAVPSPQHFQLPFPLTITAKDTLGRTVTNYSGRATLWSTVTNVPDGFYDFEEGDFSQWTPQSPAGGGPYEIVPFDVSGQGVPSLAFRLQPDWNGSDGISRPINLLAGQTYAISADVASFNANGLYVNLYPGAVALMLNGQVLTNFDFGTLGYIGIYQTFRTNLIALYTAQSNGTYQLAMRFTRPVIEQQVWHYADNVRVAPACVPTRWLADFTNGVWTENILPMTAATGVTLNVKSLFDYRGSGNQFDVTPTADFGLTGSSVPALVRAGSDVTFSFTLTNRGPSTAPSVLVSNVLEANLRFRSAAASQGSFTVYGNTVVHNLGSLSNRQQVTFSVTAKPYLTGPVTNLARVISGAFDTNVLDNAVAFALTADVPLVHADNISINELDTGTNFASVPIWLEGPVGQALSLDYATANGSATAGSDFVPVSGTLVFAPDVVTQFLTIPIRGDLIDEPNETLSLLLSNPANAALAQTQATVTIIDNDPPPVIDIADASVTEGDTGTKIVNFPLTLSKPAIVDVTVRCTTVPGTAGTNDFIPTTNTVTFATGMTNATFSVPIRGNTVNEPDETFVVTLSLPSNATIGRASAVGMILNDDAVPGRLDHFVWNAVPSPQFAGSPFPVTLRGVDYVGNPATNVNIAALVTARTGNGYLSRLQDDFEDGNSFGWTNFSSSFGAVVTPETAAGGSYSLRLTGGTGSTTAGLRSVFTNITPNRISFAVRASRTNQIAGRFTGTASGIYRSAVFYFNNNAQMGLLDRTLGFRGVPYQSNRWYQVDLTLDWVAQKIDCRIDGNLVLTNITFPDTNATYLNAGLLANQDNTTSWWDNMRVFHDNLNNTFSVTPSNFTAFVTGVKSNLVTINAAASKVWLRADDGNEHVGTSDFFDLQLLLRMGISPPTAASNVINLTIEGAPGFNYRVESSTNLATWTSVTNLQSTGMVMRLKFPPATVSGGIFYRTVVP